MRCRCLRAGARRRPATWETLEGAQGLLNYVLSINGGNPFSPTSGYAYTLAVSGETLSLNSSYPGGGTAGLLLGSGPFAAINGSPDLARAHHLPLVSDAASVRALPLIDVRQVDSDYRFTGMHYVCGNGDGLVIVRNPHLVFQLVLDSRDHQNPTRTEGYLSTEDPCPAIIGQ